MPDDYVVFWDIDGTIVRGSLERPFYRFLRGRRYLSTGRLLRNAITLLFHIPLPRWYHLKLAYLRGFPISDIDHWMDEQFETSVEPRLFAGSTATIRSLSQSNVRQVLLTGAPRPWAERIGCHVAVTEIIAAKPEYTDSRYTGRLLEGHPRGRRKVAAAEFWLRAHLYDWSRTVALANHYDDRFLLERAAIAVAVNPDTKLHLEAVRQGWQIVENPDTPFVIEGLFDRQG